MDSWNELERLIGDLKSAKKTAAKKETELKEANDRVALLSEVLIPEIMEEDLHTDHFSSLQHGLIVKLKKLTFAHISEARKEAAHHWLEENGHGGMIKREITVAFNREQEDAANDLRSDLKKKYPGVKTKKAVHAGTLKAWAAKQLEKGANLPMELLGIHTQGTVEIIEV